MKVCCAKKSKLEAKELYEKLSVTEIECKRKHIC